MVTLDSESFSLKNLEEASDVEHHVHAAAGLGGEGHPGFFGCEDEEDAANKNTGELSGCWDVAVSNEWRNEHPTEENSGEDEALEDIVLHLEDFEEETGANLCAAADGTLIATSPAARRAGIYENCGVSPRVIGKQEQTLRQHSGKKNLPRAYTSNEKQKSQNHGSVGTSKTPRGTALPRPSGASTHRETGSSRHCSRGGKASSSKHIIAALSRRATTPLRFTWEDDAATSVSSLQKGRCPVAAAPKSCPPAVTVARNSVAFLRRSCSSPLPPLNLTSKHSIHGLSAAGRKALSPPCVAKPQQQLDLLHSRQGGRSQSNTCGSYEKSNSRMRCSDVASHLAQSRGSETRACGVAAVPQQQANHPQSGEEQEQPAVGHFFWTKCWSRSLLSCRRRSLSQSLTCWGKRNGGFRWCARRRGSYDKKKCCSLIGRFFGSPERRGMCYAFLVLLLTLTGELLLLRLAAGKTSAQFLTSSTPEVRTSHDEGVEQTRTDTPASDKDVGKDRSGTHDQQQTTWTAAANAATAKGLWKAANIVYVVLLCSSLLRFCFFMSPAFAPVALVRLMMCVSTAFLSRGLWVWCSALETSAWNLQAVDNGNPSNEINNNSSARDSRSPRAADIIVSVLLDASGVWAFPSKANAGSFYQGTKNVFAAAGTLYTQSLILCILVCFWAIYTSKRWIIAYVIVPVVAATIWSLRISAAYLSAAATTAVPAGGNARAIKVVFYLPAAEATPCLLMICFVLMYHICIEAAVQKHIQSSRWGLKKTPAAYPLRTLLDRCFPSNLLLHLLASLEGLCARIDAALLYPSAGSSVCANGGTGPLATPPTQAERVLEPHTAARRGAPETGDLSPAPLYVSCASHVSVSVALSPLPPPYFLARPCTSAATLHAYSPAGDFAGTSQNTCESTGKRIVWSRSNSDGLAGHQEQSHGQRKTKRDSSCNNGCISSNSGKSNIGCSTGGSICSTAGTSSSNCSSSSSSSKGCINNRRVWRECSSKASDRNVRCTGILAYPTMGLQVKGTLPCMFHSDVTAFADVKRNREALYSDRHIQHRRRALTEPHSVTVPDDESAYIKQIKIRDMILQRVTLAYAGSGDFDFYLVVLLSRQFNVCFYKRGSLEDVEICR